MNSDDVRRLLQERIRAEGKSVSGFALEHGISQSYLWNVLHGKNKPGQKISMLVGLKPVLSYESVSGSTRSPMAGDECDWQLQKHKSPTETPNR